MTGGPRNMETLTFDEAGALYARLTGWYVKESSLAEQLANFRHLCVFRYNDVYNQDLDAEWFDSDRDELFVPVAVDRRRFEYFVKTRLALYGSGNPVFIFGLNVAPLPSNDRKGRLAD